jgi:large subunit ribosomal protein L13
MDMNKAFFLKTKNRDPRWHVIDAAGKIVGRLATEVADKLRGKDEAYYTPHIDSGDYVVVINADKVVFTGDKMTDKQYVSYSGYIGGQKVISPKDKIVRHPGFIIEHAVKGMLPKTTLGKAQGKKLYVYVGPEHPHIAQVTGFPVTA